MEAYKFVCPTCGKDLVPRSDIYGEYRRCPDGHYEHRLGYDH